MDEVFAESIALRRVSQYMQLSPQQVGASTRYIRGWGGGVSKLP